MPLATSLVTLLILAIPVACVAWTVTHEEIFREPHDWAERRSQHARTLAERKFFYLFTCEYCFSHYVAAAFLIMARFTLLFDDWRGVVIAWFSLVWVANVYMTAFARLRLDMKYQRVEIAAKEEALADVTGSDTSTTLESPAA